jgi:hypothetical protein
MERAKRIFAESLTSGHLRKRSITQASAKAAKITLCNLDEKKSHCRRSSVAQRIFYERAFCGSLMECDTMGGMTVMTYHQPRRAHGKDRRRLHVEPGTRLMLDIQVSIWHS